MDVNLIRNNRTYILLFRPLRIKAQNFYRFIIAFRLIFFPAVRDAVARNKFYGDGFITMNYVGGFNNPKMEMAWQKSIDELPKEIRNWNKEIKYRAHIVTWAASQVKDLQGDFVELGVFYGHLSKVIINFDLELLSNRNFYLVDPWGSSKLDFSNARYNEDIYEFVESRFKAYPQIKLIRNSVPDALNEVPSQKIAFLMIDMNGFEAELAALNFFYPKMVKGGIIYFDDYGGRWPRLREVVDEFLSNKPEELLTFASPNAIMIKK
jgi:O-methyltransferase